MSRSSSRSATSKQSSAPSDGAGSLKRDEAAPEARAISPKIVNCPRCATLVTWDASSPHRPFCSERCKTIDLGAWATESYRIPVEEEKDTPESDEQ